LINTHTRTHKLEVNSLSVMIYM